MAATSPTIVEFKMQPLGKSGDIADRYVSYYALVYSTFGLSAEALRKYRQARENGEPKDNTQPFPSGGFENLKIKDYTYKPDGPHGENYWPDKGRYWWRLTLEDGRIREDFYWTKDRIRGWGNRIDEDRYWFIVHGPNGVRIEGFSWEKNRDKGFPDEKINYWRYVQYTECGDIKTWMEEKDQNYCARLDREAISGIFSFSQPFKLLPHNERKTPQGLIPDAYLCPITQEIMLDPVLAMDGYTYEREVILQAFNRSMLSPMTGELVDSKSVSPNHNIRGMINEFLIQHPECGQEVYISTSAVNELLVLSSNCTPANFKRWEEILHSEPRLLTLPLTKDGLTLLEILCKRMAIPIEAYFSALFNLLMPKDWQALMRMYSAQDWLKQVTQTCEQYGALGVAAEFLKRLQAGLNIKINPLEMATYAIEQKHLGLFRLALNQLADVNEVVDAEKNTLLHLAARQGQTEMVQHLVIYCANLKQRNSLGLKAERLARQAGFEETADHIAVWKLMPVLSRMGFFSGLRRIENFEIKMQQPEASIAFRSTTRSYSFGHTPK